jgi:GAF domain-containing protein
LPDGLHATNLEDDFVRQAMLRPLAMGFHSYFGLALVSKGQVIGTICLFDVGNKSINMAKVSMLEAIGQQVGILVENARLFQSTQNALEQTEALYTAIAEMNQAESYNDILSALAGHTQLGRADQLLLMGVLDRPLGAGQKPQWIYPVAWRSDQPVEIASRYPAAMLGGVMGNTVDDKQVNATGSLDVDSQLMQAVEGILHLDQPVASISGIPLTLGDQVIGFVLALHSQKVELTADDIQRMNAIAGQAAIAVESHLLLQQAQAKARQEQRLREVTANVFAAGDVDAILRRAVEQVGRTLGTQAYIYLGKGNGSNNAQDVDETPEQPVLAKA